jgi:hypothetical protein
MNAYDAAPWGSFFTAEVGGAAALTGLLFVAVSINLGRILDFPKLPARAAETLGILLLAVIVASVALVPQAAGALGVEVASAGLLFAGVTLRVQVTHGPDSPDDPRSWFVSRVAATAVPSPCFVLGGVSLAAHAGGGIYWLVPGLLLAFAGAAYNAWVLLVEIIRQNPKEPRDTTPSGSSAT